MFTKQLCLLCSGVAEYLICSTAVKKRIYENSSGKIIRKFSSKNSGNRNKNPQKVIVKAKNDFVTHHLNTSISTHLRRQQKILDYIQEEEKRLVQQNKKKDLDDSFIESVSKHNHRYSSRSKTASKQNTNYSKQNHQQKHHPKKYSNENHPINVEKKRNKKNAIVFHDVEPEDLSSEIDLSGSDSDDFEVEKLETPNWNDMNLVEINDKFYKPSKETELRSADDIKAFRSKMHIKCSDGMPKPIFKFNELNELPANIITEIEEQCLMECTAIQSQGLPMAISGINMICVSQPR